MPVLCTKGSLAVQAFGFTNVNAQIINPYIVRVTTPSYLNGASLFSDGSLLVLANSGSLGNYSVLAANTRTPSASVSLGMYVTNNESDQSPVTNNKGTMPYIEGFARVNPSATLLLAKQAVNAYGTGGTVGTGVAYDDTSGETFHVSDLYATGASTFTTPHIRKFNSSGTLVANLNISTDSAYNDIILTQGCAIDSTYVYISTVGYTLGAPIVWVLSRSLGSATPYIPSGFTSSVFARMSEIAVDASNNIYFCVYDSTNGGTTLFKYSSGMATKLYAVTLSGYTPSNGASVAVDNATGNVYWVIGTSGTNALILQTNSSLTPLFAKQISISTTGDNWSDMQISNDAMCFVNKSSGYAFVLPKNGTRTGTYSVGGGTVIYSSVSIPSYSSTSGTWATTTGYSTTRSYTVTTPTSSAGTAFSVSSLSI